MWGLVLLALHTDAIWLPGASATEAPKLVLGLMPMKRGMQLHQSSSSLGGLVGGDDWDIQALP